MRRAPLPEERDRPHGRRRRGHARRARVRGGGVERPPDALDRFLAIYDARLLKHTRPYRGMPRRARRARRARAALAVLTNKPLAATRRILDGLDLARHFPPTTRRRRRRPVSAQARSGGAAASRRARPGVAVDATLLVGDSAIDWRTARAAGLASASRATDSGSRAFRVDELAPDDRVIDAPVGAACRCNDSATFG